MAQYVVSAESLSLVRLWCYPWYVCRLLETLMHTKYFEQLQKEVAND